MRFAFYSTLAVGALFAVEQTQALASESFDALQDNIDQELMQTEAFLMSDAEYEAFLAQVKAANELGAMNLAEDVNEVLAQVDVDNEAESSSSSSSGSDDSKSSSSSSSDSDGSDSSDDKKAQVGAEDDEYDLDLAQINAEIEEAERQENLDFFVNYMSQIGIEESEALLAQLQAELSDDQI